MYTQKLSSTLEKLRTQERDVTGARCEGLKQPSSNGETAKRHLKMT